MRLVVTRPREDAEAFAKALRARGHEAVVAPVMEVHIMAGAPIALEGVQAVLATSANGVRALAKPCSRPAPTACVRWLQAASGVI